MPHLSAIILTLFPEMFPGPLGLSLAGKALEKGIWSLQTFNIRDFATDKHRTVDDSPYGGGAGMVMKPDVLALALDHAKSLAPDATLIYPSPRGVPMTQALVQKLMHPSTIDHRPSFILLCGRFEGIDQRIIDHYGLLEVSLGDFVLSGGEIAAMALLDAAVRLLPGVIGNDEAIQNDSFASFRRTPESSSASVLDPDFHRDDENSPLLLEYPHYTRPPVWNGHGVPDVILSGDHEKIRKWRLEQAIDITRKRRPELLK